jgi:hypothetical protein
MRHLKCALVLTLMIGLPASAMAQDDQSHWGVAASINPTWKAMDKMKMFWDAENALDIKSTDFSIGLARGKTLGGDWNVSYFNKSFKDGSTVDGVETECDTFVPGCFKSGSIKTLRDVKLTGILAMKYINFATIKNRVQIGLNVGGGVGTLSGPVDVLEYDVDVSCNNRGQCTGTQTQHSQTVDAGAQICDGDECEQSLFALSKVPLGKVELAVGAIVAPGFKVRASGGFDFPGSTTFSVTGVYLIGAR